MKFCVNPSFNQLLKERIDKIEYEKRQYELWNILTDLMAFYEKEYGDIELHDADGDIGIITGYDQHLMNQFDVCFSYNSD